MSLKGIIGTALLGLGLNYCASMPLNYQGQPLTQTEQQRFVDLKDKVDYLKSVSKKEYDKAGQDSLDARTVDQYYDAQARYTLFWGMQISDKDPNLNQRVQRILVGYSQELENPTGVERWVNQPHQSGRRMVSSQGFGDTCLAVKRIDPLLQKEGIKLENYSSSFPIREASQFLGELWGEKYRCKHQ
jgi:hypothetical protein